MSSFCCILSIAPGFGNKIFVSGTPKYVRTQNTTHTSLISGAWEQYVLSTVSYQSRCDYRYKWLDRCLSAIISVSDSWWTQWGSVRHLLYIVVLYIFPSVKCSVILTYGVLGPYCPSTVEPHDACQCRSNCFPLSGKCLLLSSMCPPEL